MITAEFKRLYKSLNPAQRQAVDTIEGSVMVIAGPGTGKTQTLTLRIANILLKTQTNPENILALTFTESASYEMRQRLLKIIGTPAYKVEISTFHGFCNEVIARYPDEFPKYIGSVNISEIEQIQFVESILSRSRLKLLKPFGDPLFHVKNITSSINQLKQEGVSVEDLDKAIKKSEEDFGRINDLHHEKGKFKGKLKGKYALLQKNIQKNKELLSIYKKYESELTQRRVYDYNDMLLSVVSVLEKNSQMLLRLQELYQYILVDEHQDTNAAQNKLVQLLASYFHNPNLFVVGDVKQSIFRFQGANLENFLFFQKLYPDAKLISLQQNYRSVQPILDAATSLITKNVRTDIFAGKKTLISKKNGSKDPIKIINFEKGDIEQYFVVNDINKKILDNVPLGEIAVLSRRNADLRPFARALSQYGLDYVLEAEDDILTDPQIQKLLFIFEAIADFGSDTKLIRAMHIDFFQIDQLDIYKLMNLSKEKKISIYEILSANEYAPVKFKKPGKIRLFFKKVNDWNKQKYNDSLVNFFASIVNNSGCIQYLQKIPGFTDNMEKISALYDEVKSLSVRNPKVTLDDFLSYLKQLEKHQFSIRKSANIRTRNAIRLMSVHRAKGLEFDYVYIVKAVDGIWGSSRQRASFFNLPWLQLGIKADIETDEQLEDERRLFYVALTRARFGVTVSYSTISEDNKEQLPSQFLFEIDPKFKIILEATSFEEFFAQNRQIIFDPKKYKKPGVKNKEYFANLFTQQGLSPTALNNYLDCPWKYFYRNLLRLPVLRTRSLIFGELVHQTLHELVLSIKKKRLNKKEFIARYVNWLDKQAVSDADYVELYKKGKEVLGNFYTKKTKNWSKDLLSEIGIRGVELTEGVFVNGRIDMIDPVGPYNEVVVYDFKTGQPKTKAQIKGETKNGNGDYYRQLVFYQLLMDLYYSGRYKMVKGVIEFVEPDKQKKFRSEEFVISGREVEELYKLVLQTADEIVNLSFWNKKCGDEKCEYCALRSVMSS
jgi:DNA helicase II / ATP-dependent DNA helicase PcrA